MAIKSLAIKYRPKTFDDIVEQDAIKTILCQQLNTDSTKNAYLFCGPAGDGKTTTARIFANEINNGEGNPIEMDAASNNSVDDVREIINQAKTKSLNSEYKVFIIDECHSLSNTAWQAMLKLIEEPPAKSIFIFCTTDPQKIPKTILSRVQRYDFQRISQLGIMKRLSMILVYEHDRTNNSISWEHDALEYIAKLADGGMRDAITLLDKCLAYSTRLTLENVVKALGTVNYEIMFDLNDAILDKKCDTAIKWFDEVHKSGKDLKQILKQYTNFILDICKYEFLKDFDYLQIPATYRNWVEEYNAEDYKVFKNLLTMLLKLNSDIKWDSSPKYMIEAQFIVFINGGNV